MEPDYWGGQPPPPPQPPWFLLHWKARILVRKLGFLLRLVSTDGHELGARTFQSMSDDMESLCLVRECRQLEKTFQTHYTDKILGCGDQMNVRDIKKEVYKIDKRMKLITHHLQQSPLRRELVGYISRKGCWIVVKGVCERSSG